MISWFQDKVERNDYSVEYWQEMLESEEWDSRFLAAKNLGKLKANDAVLSLIELLNDENSNVRASAAVALGEIGDNRAVESLLQAIAEPDEWVRLQVVESLAKIGDCSISPMLAQFLENEYNVKVKASIIKVLGQLGGEEMLPVLSIYLKDEDRRVRANAVEALEMLNMDISHLLLPLVKTDGDHRFQANIAKALHTAGDIRGIKMLKKMLQDSDPRKRAASAWALGETNNEDAVKALLTVIEDDVWFVEKNCIKALIKLGDKAIRSMMSIYRKTSSVKVKMNLISAFGEMGDSRAKKILILALSHENGEIRAKAEEALDKLDA